MKKITLLILVLLLVSVSAPGLAAPKEPFNPENAPTQPDYSQKDSWLVLPEKPGAHPVDVFWVYPTIFFDDSGWLMDIKDVQLKSAARETLETQASVFSVSANIYAPLYRQMNIAGLGLDEESKNTIMAYGQNDVIQAFEYYMKNLNQGRPFILAGHSQGSNQLTDLMISRWGKTGAEKRLVAAYLIGWSVTPQNMKDNPFLKICEQADQVGCIVTYNTMAPGRQSAAPTRIPGTLVVNPLSWNTTGEFQAADKNLGAVFFDEEGGSKTYPNFTSAQIKDSGLVVIPEDPALLETPDSIFPKGVYHKFDYSLFYENLKTNVKIRIRSFVKKQ